MTKPTTTEVEVTQEDREAAAPFLRLYGAENYALICEKGLSYCDQLAVVQAFARHRTRTSPEAGELVERLRAERREIRDRIPMDYLERHGNDLAAAMKDYAEDRWKLLGRLKRLEEAGDRMAGEFRRTLDHLDAWARDHSDDATTETWAILYCGPSALTDWRAVREGG